MLDLDVLAFIDHNITVNVIKDGKIVSKKELQLPKEIRNVIQQQIRRILALGAEEGLISGGFSEEYQTMCFLGAVGSYLASLQAQLLPEPQARAYAYQMLIRSLSAASPAEAPAL